jgi:uncharacterized protein (TIGR00255 family)
MTGFGRGSAGVGEWQAAVEITSVNRKQAEVVIQTAHELNELDSRLRKVVLRSISRGRIQVVIHLESSAQSAEVFSINPFLAKAYAQGLAEISTVVGYPVQPTAADFQRQPGIIANGNREIDAEAAWLAIEPALMLALSQLVAMRTREGDHLRTDFLERLDSLAGLIQSIHTEAPARLIHQRESMLLRLSEADLPLDLNDERVIKEIAIFADRCDISEEITRLGSHLMKFREYLAAAEPPGRALDFLCQELFRELNTLGSKAHSASIAHTIVAAKTELEKIREQVQNVE